jgi:hypothetical protein
MHYAGLKLGEVMGVVNFSAGWHPYGRRRSGGLVTPHISASIYYSQRAPVPPMMTTINPSGILTIMI